MEAAQNKPGAVAMAYDQAMRQHRLLLADYHAGMDGQRRTLGKHVDRGPAEIALAELERQYAADVSSVVFREPERPDGL